MTAGDALMLWGSAYCTVFLLVSQSRFVHSGRYLSAALGSFCITAMQLVFVKVAAGGADPLTFLMVAGSAGSSGSVSAMWLTRRLRRPGRLD